MRGDIVTRLIAVLALLATALCLCAHGPTLPPECGGANQPPCCWYAGQRIPCPPKS